jgi:hypothetical protein
MARRRKNENEGLEALFEVVAYAWRSSPLHGVGIGLAFMLAFCLLFPALLMLLAPALPTGPATVANIASAPMRGLLSMFANLSFWVGVGVGSLCFVCAAINLFRGKSAEQRLLLVKPTFQPKGPPVIPFVRKPLLTPTELTFYKRLQAAFPDVAICPQLALAAVVDIPAKYNEGRYRHVNRAPFASKYADFAIVDPDTGDVLAIIELDDYSHDDAERQAEDEARDAMLAEVGIEVHRFDARKMPTVEKLQEWFGAV